MPDQDLSKLTIAELLDLAKGKGIAIESGLKKAEIIAAIEAALDDTDELPPAADEPAPAPKPAKAKAAAKASDLKPLRLYVSGAEFQHNLVELVRASSSSDKWFVAKAGIVIGPLGNPLSTPVSGWHRLPEKLRAKCCYDLDQALEIASK